MKRSETAALLAKVVAPGTGQPVDPPTARVDDPKQTPITSSWHELLGDLDFADCCDAVVRLQQTPRRWPMLMPADVREQALKIREERIKASSIDSVVPNVDPDDPVAYAAEVRALVAAAAAGQLDRAAYERGGWTLSGAPAQALSPLAPGPVSVALTFRTLREA